MSELQTICNMPGPRRGGGISNGIDDQLGAEIKIPQNKTNNEYLLELFFKVIQKSL